MIWLPDTCECVINLDNKTFIYSCKFHNPTICSVIDVIDHNKKFNLSGKTDKQIIEDKQIELERIKALT